MYEEIKSIEFLGEMKINELYYLYKTNSSEMNLEIFSKLQKYLTCPDFFKHYVKKDIKIFYENIDNFINKISSISQNNIKFSSKVDQYISDFSCIYILFNLIFKINNSIANILLNTKPILLNLYEKYNLDKISQEKINECINNLLRISSNIKFNQKNLSKSSTKDNSNGSLDHNDNTNRLQNLLGECNANVNKEFFHNDNEQILIKDLLGKQNIKNESKNNNSNVTDCTPRFSNIINSNTSFSNLIQSNRNNNNSNEGRNKESELKLSKQNSIDSEFTLSSNEKIKNEKEKKKENIINESISNTEIKNDMISNNFKDYITNIEKNELFFNKKKGRKSCIYKFNTNTNIEKINRNKSIDILNKKNIFSSFKGDINNNKSFEKIKSNKNFHVSSGHLFMKEESKMYADLLEIIIELYKYKKISLQQKLKLKKLIISRSPVILNVYKYFNNDNEKFVIELKKLIQ